jgi:hypothetical protein
MLRAFVVFIEVAALVILLRTSFVQYWLSDIQTSVSGWMISISEIPERQELGRMRDDLYPEITDMSESQIKYLDSILQNKASLKRFYKLYCINGDINPFVYGTALQQVCNTAQQSGLIGSARAT